MRHADDGGAELFEGVGGLGELVRLDRAAHRERGRVEVKHHRALLQRVGERELEHVAAERGIGLEVGRLLAHVQARIRRVAQQRNAGRGDGQQLVHCVSFVDSTQCVRK